MYWKPLYAIFLVIWGVCYVYDFRKERWSWVVLDVAWISFYVWALIWG